MPEECAQKLYDAYGSGTNRRTSSNLEGKRLPDPFQHVSLLNTSITCIMLVLRSFHGFRYVRSACAGFRDGKVSSRNPAERFRANNLKIVEISRIIFNSER